MATIAEIVDRAEALLEGDAGERLFEDRSPVAAAVQLATVLAWATECELATLERLRTMKSASKHDLERHYSIACKLLYHCWDLKVRPQGLEGKSCPRLAELLARGNPVAPF